MSRRALTLLLAVGSAALLAVAPSAAAAPTRTQRFFEDRLLRDPRTSESVADLLRSDGFVDRSVTFRDLTGDDRADAVVRVQTSGAAGAVAVYVFSMDTGERGSGLRVVFRSQRLLRAGTSVLDGVLTYTTARPAPGDELCCPALVLQTSLRWDDDEHRFRIADRREVPGPRPEP